MPRVEVVYATPAIQQRYVLNLEEGATVEAALEQSGVLHEFPQLDLARHRVGIYGRLVALDEVLRDGDRVEILRPLTAEPGAARKRRARAQRRLR
jgi:putative ubiquitin-RnfH superfamily antitoxin RatB of RatAB toxin-antitoxin module